MREELIKAFDLLGEYITNKPQELELAVEKAYQHNTWFSNEECNHALSAWAKLLQSEKLSTWLADYPDHSVQPKKIGLILAGNIPLVGFQDICNVLFSGHYAYIKLSSQDTILIPHLLEKLISFYPGIQKHIVYTERMNDIDAIIATGSNNSAKHFEYYFGNKPHIIRKNRNSIAILTGKENSDDFYLLGEDIFRYYGQGCRNVSKLYVPTGYNFSPLLDTLEQYNYIADQHKYLNNYNYYKSIYLVNREHHLDTGFLLIKENKSLQAPLSVIYFEYYNSTTELESNIAELQDQIQCVVTAEHIQTKNQLVGFGKSQSPGWMDYADGVDTMEFLLGL